jgi:glutamate transport system permease protein
VSSAIVIAMIYIGLNTTLGALASWLERRSRRTTIGAAGSPPCTSTIGL